MVAVGDEGFGLIGENSYPYGTSEGLDFAKNLAIPDIDLGTFHFYPDTCTSLFPRSLSDP